MSCIASGHLLRISVAYVKTLQVLAHLLSLQTDETGAVNVLFYK